MQETAVTDRPTSDEIIIERVLHVGYSDYPPMLEVEIEQIERGELRSRRVLRFSEAARFAILEAAEQILIRTGRVIGNPNKPESVQ